MESKFKIGDRVRSEWFGDGTVTDIYSGKNGGNYLYEVTPDDGVKDLFDEDELKLIPAVPEKAEYRFEIEVADNVVIARMFRCGKESKVEIKRNHGHVIHLNEVGYAQAASYALKRMYFEMRDGGEINV